MLKILVVFLGAVGTLGATLAGIWYKHRLDKKKDRIVNAIGDYASEVHEVYTVIGELNNTLQADRVMILKVTNGGGIPSAGCTLYSSVVWETFGKKLGSMRDDWNAQPLDENYISIISEIFQKGFCYLKTEEIGEGDLRDLYQAQGIKCGEMYFLENFPGITLYMSVQHCKAFDPEEAKNKDAIRTSLQKIKGHVGKMNYED